MMSFSAVCAEEVTTNESISFDDTSIYEIDASDDVLNQDEGNKELSSGNTIYISPDGTGSGSSETDPTNWNDAISKVGNGGSIQFLDGNYTNINGYIYRSIELKGTGNSIIDAQKDGGFFTTYAGSTVTIEKLSFINAYTGEKQGNPDGPKTGYDGEGGIVNNGVLIVKNCYFASNQGIGTEGGAIHNSGTCYVYDSTFFGNGGKKGGAIYSDKNSRLYMYDSIVNKCVSREGSAVHAKEAYVEIHNCSVVNASAKNGLFYVKKSTIYIYDSYFFNSKAVDAAGVINIDKESTVEIYGSIFDKISSTGTKLWFHDENGTGNGGAIVVEKSAKNVIIKDCSFTNCSAKGYGGAIYIQSATAMTIDNCTFKSNKAEYGNHIYSYPSPALLTISNSLFEIESSIETSDINSSDVEIVKISCDDGTNNILNPTISVLLDGDVKESLTSADVTFKDLKSGNHNVSLIASDSNSNKYIFSQDSSVFNVADEDQGIVDTVIVASSKFSRSAVDYYAGERGAFFYVVLKDVNGNRLSDKSVQFIINGKKYNRTTNDEGKAGLKISLAQAKTYTCSIKFDGDEKYNKSSASSKITIVKKKTTISASNKIFKAKTKTKSVKVTLKTIKNKYNGKTYLKAGKKLTLKVKGKTYTAKINKKGVATFKIKITKKGKYTAKIKFAGDKTYKASNKTIKITIK